MHTTMSDWTPTVGKPCFIVAAGRINGIQLRNGLISTAIGFSRCPAENLDSRWLDPGLSFSLDMDLRPPQNDRVSSTLALPLG